MRHSGISALRASACWASVCGLCLAAAPALAQTAVSRENVKPGDIVSSPLKDLNVRKKDMPVVLEMAMAKPYTLAGVKSCKGLIAAIKELDAVLGDDIDVASGEKSDMQKAGNGAGAVAKYVLNSFIPFRGIIREVSGANSQERLWEQALYAGVARRAFLKGMGEQRGCAYPARSATPAVLAKISSEREQAKLARSDDKNED